MSKWDVVEIVFGCAVAVPLGLAFGIWILKEVFEFDLIAALRKTRR